MGMFYTKWINNMKRGFTLVECMIVVAIIGMLGAVIIPAVMGARQDTKLREMGYDNAYIHNLKESHAYSEIKRMIESGNLPDSFNNSVSSSPSVPNVSTDNPTILRAIDVDNGETKSIGSRQITVLKINGCQYIELKQGGSTSLSHAGLCENVRHKMGK